MTGAGESAAPRSSPSVPSTNPDGGWGRAKVPLPAPALDLGAPLPQVARPIGTVVLRTLLLSAQDPAVVPAREDTLSAGERARLPGDAAERRRYVAERAGLRLLLASCLGAAPQGIAVDAGPCPHCGADHGRTASARGRPPLFVATAAHRDLVVLALAAAPVGLGLAVPEGPDREALLRARKPARVAAGAGARARGRCREPRTSGVARHVEYVSVPPEGECVVSVVWQEHSQP
ncbi:hypothetical protein [Streptomyces flavofungini]|uniref:hypothetical protein n=1 Tax=Streptomyces flavofungini TaxID=68200 RepID=UPI0025B0847E|nr:hypothetical protein [Streptomyces flavofungini]WJV44933.1 hypothetical protein QUY26_04925 [Streptomyces flavofungini]